MAVIITKKKTKKYEKPIRKIVGLDISTRTGYAMVWQNPDGLEIVETAEYTAANTVGNIARADAICSQIVPSIVSSAPDLVMIEGFGYGNRFTLVLLAEISTVIRHTLYKCGVEYHEVPPTSMKKFVTGKGNAKKDMVMKEVYKRWDFEGTDNECDAVGLAMFGAALYDLVALPQVNLQAVKDWRKANKI